jgi:hypothetical protein
MRNHRSMRTLAYMLVAVVAGCGSPAPSTAVDPGWCQALAGNYLAHFTTRSGNCGDLPESVVTIGDTSTTATCAETVSYAPDRCSVDFHMSCPLKNAATGASTGTFDEVGTIHTSRTSPNASATIQMTIHDAAEAFVCSGTYDVIWSKL